jgi:hypothetical protein
MIDDDKVDVAWHDCHPSDRKGGAAAEHPLDALGGEKFVELLQALLPWWRLALGGVRE